MNKYCISCGRPVNPNAHFCIGCGGQANRASSAEACAVHAVLQPNQRRPSSNAKIVCVIGAALLVLLIVAGRKPSEDDTGGASHDYNESVIDPPLKTLSGTALVQQYEANEVAADQMYKGKKVLIQGRVGEIGKDILDTPYLMIDESEYGLGGVQAFFSEGDLPTLAHLAKGEMVEVVGTVDGLMMYVHLKDSVVRRKE